MFFSLPLLGWSVADLDDLDLHTEVMSTNKQQADSGVPSDIPPKGNPGDASERNELCWYFWVAKDL